MYALEVENLTIGFKMYGKRFERTFLPVITNLNVKLKPGEIHAVVGSSGSGKSLLAHAILGILPENSVCTGKIFWHGEPMTPDLQKRLRGSELALVPQSVSFLDPLKRVGKQICKNKKAGIAALAAYGLDKSDSRMFPFELSGGMARRVLVATAAASKAEIIIADEPTPGLSDELARSAMQIFRDLADGGAGILLITHDIDLAIKYADRISVFYAGTTVETANAVDFLSENSLRHPYSRALWRAMPQHGFTPTPGSQPYPGSVSEGCLFAPRCRQCTDLCRKIRPEPRELRDGEVCCHHAD